MEIPARVKVPRFAGGGRIEFTEQDVPRPGPGQLLLKVGANALCGSERGQFYHGSGVVPGHEGAGTVVAAGAGTATPIGALGAVYLMDFCGDCRSCLAGATNQCLQKRADMGFNRDGAYAPYELVSEKIFFPVGEDISPAEATLLLDIMGTGGHALDRAGLVHRDIRSVVVTGAGPIGLGVAAMVKLRLGNGFPVLIADTVPYRLRLAERLGALPIDLRQTALAEGAARHGCPAVDCAIETAGKLTAREEALALLAQRGVLVCVGHGETCAFDVSNALIAPERAVLGSEYFPFETLPANLALLRAHKDYLGQIITDRMPVSEIQAAFELFFRGEAGKVVIVQ